MAKMDDQISRRYVYQSQHDTSKHKGKKSVYLVEQMRGSNVIARVKPLGMVRETTAVEEITIALINESITVVGKWAKTKRGHHSRSRAVLGSEFEVN